MPLGIASPRKRSLLLRKDFQRPLRDNAPQYALLSLPASACITPNSPRLFLVAYRVQ